MTARLILVRHGEPVGHDGRCVGHFDTELAPSAAVPLRRLAQSMIARPLLVVSSDLRRSAASAAVIAGVWRAELRFDPRLRELSFGNWEGRSWQEIGDADRGTLDAWGADWTRHGPPGGESGVAFAARVHAALDDILAMAARATPPIAVVSHAGWIRVATTLLLREPLSSAFDRAIDYASAAVFTVRDTFATLDAWNVALVDDAFSDAGARPRSPRSAPL